MKKVVAIHEVVRIPAPRPPIQRPNNPAETVLKNGRVKTKRYICFYYKIILSSNKTLG